MESFLLTLDVFMICLLCLEADLAPIKARFKNGILLGFRDVDERPAKKAAPKKPAPQMRR